MLCPVHIQSEHMGILPGWFISFFRVEVAKQIVLRSFLLQVDHTEP